MESSVIARTPHRRLRGAGLRLAFWLPLTPWPALFLIVAQGEFSTGRHRADALAPVVGWAYLAALAVHVGGLILLLAHWRREEQVPLWICFALVNAVAMGTYIGANGSYYV